VECMNQGLIPIVSRACVLDVGDFGLLLETCSIREIQETVRMVIQQPVGWHRERSEKARADACERHSPASFERTLRSHLDLIIAEQPGTRAQKINEVQTAAANPPAYLNSHNENLGKILNAARWFVDHRRFAEAEPYVVRVLEMEPECVTALCLMADLEFARGHSENADQLLGKASECSPGDRQALQKLNRTLDGSSRDGSADQDIAAADSLIKSGAYAEAAAILSQWMVAHPDHRESLRLLGEAQFQMGEHEQGIAATQKAAALPGGEGAVRNLGWMLLHRKQWSEALALYDRLSVASPYDNEILVKRTYLRMKLNLLGKEN